MPQDYIFKDNYVTIIICKTVTSSLSLLFFHVERAVWTLASQNTLVIIVDNRTLFGYVVT